MSNINKELENLNNNLKLSKKLNDVIFLRAKLNYQKEEIAREYGDFTKKLSKQLLDKNKATLKNMNKTNSIEVKMTTFLHSIIANDPLFYHFDSFLVDIRRCVEFCLRLTLLNLNLKDDDGFKVQSFMDHICKMSKKTKPKFVTMLVDNHAWFIEYLKNDNIWLYNLNQYRTDAIHYKILNKMGPCKIEYFWNSLQELEAEPTITVSNLNIAGINIEFNKFVDSYLFKLDFFIEQIIKLNNEILKNNSPNSTV